jgi:osmotically-inducible protein OsmY
MYRRFRTAFALATTLVVTGAISASAAMRNAASPSVGARAAADSATGCLQKGDKPGTFKLVSKDGKSWDVTSTKIPLAGHVGHTVTLSGDTMKSDMSSMKDTSMSKMKMSDSSKSGTGMSSGTLNVTSMTMVSATCS